MKKFLNIFVAIPLVLFLLAGSLFVLISLIYFFEPGYVQMKIDDPSGYLDKPNVGFLFLILPAEYIFSQLTFSIIAAAVIPAQKSLGLNLDAEEINDILIKWCPLVLIALIVAYRFYMYPSIYFLNKYDYFGILMLAAIILRLYVFKSKKAK